MSRADRRKKEKKEGLGIILLIIFIIVFGIILGILVNRKNKTKKIDIPNAVTNSSSYENVINEGENNVVNETTENVIQNSVENEVVNETITNKTENTTKPNNSSTNSNGAGITDKKQASIDLVEKEWGKDDTVDFVFDYVNENGEYVIAVRDRTSATIKCYYRVNLETKTVELD